MQTTIQRQKIRFLPKDKPEFIIDLRRQIEGYFNDHHLSKYGNSTLIFKTAIVFSLYILPYIFMISGIIDSFALVFLCWILIGLGKAGVGMDVMHDANHRTLSKNRRVNSFFSNSLYLLGGFPPNWQHQHNTMHHGFTNIDDQDEDIDPGPYLRFSPHKPLYKIHRYQHLYAWFLYGLMTFSWVTSKDFVQLNRYRKEGVRLNSRKNYPQLFTTLVIAKLVYYSVFLVVPMIVLPFAWYWVIVFFLAMHFTSGFILTVIFQTAHVVPSTDFPLPDENGTIENNWAIHQLATTSNFAPKNKLLSWFIGGLNYQVEHHLFPNICHVHYRKISEIVKSTALKYKLPYHVQPGFIRAVIEHGRMLRNLGRKQIHT